MIEPTRRNWSPDDLFAGLEASMFAAPKDVIEGRRVKLWKDLYTEYDARHFGAELQRRAVVRTDDAKAFFAAWDADERRHTSGFVQLMELVAGSKSDDLWQALDARQHVFASIEPYLSDEFSVLVLIAFDEMATCQAYAEGKPFYEQLGRDIFLDWLREVIADEAVHCTNAMRVIRGRHADRIPEMSTLLDKLVTPVAEASGYQGTFVLDHFGAGYSVSGLTDCRDRLLKAANRLA